MREALWAWIVVLLVFGLGGLVNIIFTSLAPDISTYAFLMGAPHYLHLGLINSARQNVASCYFFKMNPIIRARCLCFPCTPDAMYAALLQKERLSPIVSPETPSLEK
jgi:hypothetical protein